MVTGVFFDPDSFFRNVREDPSFVYAAVIVFLTGLANVLGIVGTMNEVTELVSESSRAFLALGYTISIVGIFVGLFVVWLVYASLFHTISRLFDGEGPFRETFILSGWGFVPQIFGGLVSSFALIYVLHSTTLPSDPEVLQMTVTQLKSGPIMTTARTVGVAFTIWSGFIWTFAVKHARNVNVKQATLTVSLPVLITILLNFYSF